MPQPQQVDPTTEADGYRWEASAPCSYGTGNSPWGEPPTCGAIAYRKVILTKLASTPAPTGGTTATPTPTPTATPTPTPSLIPTPTSPPVTVDGVTTWTEDRTPAPKTFHARLDITVDEVREVYGDSSKDIINPVQMKSGYGVEVTVTTRVITDYDRPGSITGAAAVKATLPDGVELLECISPPGSQTNTWRFRINTQSGLNRREHYIPVAYPDNRYYTMTFQATGASAGGSGELTAAATYSIYIKGSMYDDDHTGGSH